MKNRRSDRADCTRSRVGQSMMEMPGQFFVGPQHRNADCVASPTSGRTTDGKMRDFELLRGGRRWSEVYEQTRVSPIYGGTEVGDIERSGAAGSDGKRGVSASWFGTLGAVSLACGGTRWLGRGAEARCAACAA